MRDFAKVFKVYQIIRKVGVKITLLDKFAKNCHLYSWNTKQMQFTFLALSRLLEVTKKKKKEFRDDGVLVVRCM